MYENSSVNEVVLVGQTFQLSVPTLGDLFPYFISLRRALSMALPSTRRKELLILMFTDYLARKCSLIPSRATD